LHSAILHRFGSIAGSWRVVSLLVLKAQKRVLHRSENLLQPFHVLIRPLIHQIPDLFAALKYQLSGSQQFGSRQYLFVQKLLQLLSSVEWCRLPHCPPESLNQRCCFLERKYNETEAVFAFDGPLRRSIAPRNIVQAGGRGGPKCAAQQGGTSLRSSLFNSPGTSLRLSRVFLPCAGVGDSPALVHPYDFPRPRWAGAFLSLVRAIGTEAGTGGKMLDAKRMLSAFAYRSTPSGYNSAGNRNLGRVSDPFLHVARRSPIAEKHPHRGRASERRTKA
jgi:hypothetical protein